MLHQPHEGTARFQRRADVEEAKLIGAGSTVGTRLFDGIAGVAEILEADAFHHPAVLDVQAGDDPPGQHAPSSAVWPSATVNRPS